MTGILRDPDGDTAATGTITFWPRRLLGQIIGARRITLDVTAERGRLQLDGGVGPPPYPFGITLPARLSDATDRATDRAAVTVRIDPAQLVGLWIHLNL